MQVTYNQKELVTALIDYVKNRSGLNLEGKTIEVRFNSQGTKKREVYATVDINQSLTKHLPDVETVENVVEAPEVTAVSPSTPLFF